MEKKQRVLSDSASARWTVLLFVSIAMFAGYFVADVMSPLQNKLSAVLSWNASDFGLFSGAYAWFNVFLFFLIFGGFILDKKGVRFTGIMSILIMLIGASLIYWAISTHLLDKKSWSFLFGTFKAQVWMASIGFAIFGVGIEIAGITVSNIIVKWFKGKSMALAMGLQLSLARLGTTLALNSPLYIISVTGKVSSPVFFSLIMLTFGLIAFIAFAVMDKKLDKTLIKEHSEQKDSEDEFRIRDVLSIIKNRAWWYISILCVLFYSTVFPFIKYATNLLHNNYGFNDKDGGLIASLLPFGCILFTPIFGSIYDKKGKGATIMIIGAFIVFFSHLMFKLPFVNYESPLVLKWIVAIFIVMMIGVGFSLVPCAMWPSFPKIIPYKQLGTAYAVTFWLQNLVALWALPTAIGFILNKYCIIGMENGEQKYDYSLPMYLFMSIGILAIIFSFLLKAEDKKKGYGLENPNIEESK
jgi:nitrate/nitrite transporter NarK